MRTPTRVSAVLASLAAAAALGVAPSCGKPDPSPGAAGPAQLPSVDVRTSKVTTRPAPRIVRATGTFRADDEVTVAAETAGRVVAAPREVGDAVATGDLLARVDDADARLELAERERALAESLSKVGLERLPDGDGDAETAIESLPAVERAKLEAENAKARFERGKSLHARVPPLISDQDFEDLRTAASVAESAVRVARLDARARIAEARTRAAQIALAARRVSLSVHSAPSGRAGGDGAAPAVRFTVAQRFVSVGDFVRVGDPLYRLVRTDPIRLAAQVPERRAAGALAGRMVRITAPGAERPVEARITRVRPEADPRSRSIEAEIDVPNASGAFAPGGFATVEIDLGEDAGVAAVHASAVRSWAGVRKVFVVADGKAAERVVVLGREFPDGAVELTSGVKPGDVVVVDPPASLVSGSPVRVVEGGK